MRNRLGEGIVRHNDHRLFALGEFFVIEILIEPSAQRTVFPCDIRFAVIIWLFRNRSLTKQCADTVRFVCYIPGISAERHHITDLGIGDRVKLGRLLGGSPVHTFGSIAREAEIQSRTHSAVVIARNISAGIYSRVTVVTGTDICRIAFIRPPATSATTTDVPYRTNFRNGAPFYQGHLPHPSSAERYDRLYHLRRKCHIPCYRD